MRVSIDTAFYKSELLRMSVHVWRTIELDALQIFKAVVDFRRSNKGCCAPASGAFKRYHAVKTAGRRVGHQVVSSPQSKTPAFERGEPIAGLCRTAAPAFCRGRIGSSQW